MGNKEVKKITLHCSAVGNLSPAILGCEKCEDCQHDFDFRDSGGCSGVVLTGARENVAAAVNRPGIFFDDVVIVNAEYYQLMINAIDKCRNYIKKRYLSEPDCSAELDFMEVFWALEEAEK